MLHQEAYRAIAENNADALDEALGHLREGKFAIKVPDLWRDAARQGRLKLFDQLYNLRDGGGLMREDFLHGLQGAVIGQQQEAINWLQEKSDFILSPEENMEMAMLCARYDLVDRAQEHVGKHMRMAIDDEKKDKLFFKYLEVCIEHNHTALALDVIEQRFKQKDKNGQDRRFNDFHQLVTKAASESKHETLAMLIEQGEKWLSQKHLSDLATKLALQVGSESALYMVVQRLTDLPALENDLLRNLLYRMGTPTKDVLNHPLQDAFFKLAAADGIATRMLNLVDNFDYQLGIEDWLYKKLETTAQEWRDHHEAVLRQKYAQDPRALQQFAAKHDVLDVFLRDKTLPPLEPKHWENTSLLPLLMANGHIRRVIAPDLWVKRTDTLVQLLAALPRDKAAKIGGPEALAEARRLSLAATPRVKVTFSGDKKKP